MHIGAAIVVFYNFLKAFIESCEDGPALRYGLGFKGSNQRGVNKMHLSGYRQDESVESLQRRWKADIARREALCGQQDNRTRDSDEDCTYAWMVSGSNEDDVTEYSFTSQSHSHAPFPTL